MKSLRKLTQDNKVVILSLILTALLSGIGFLLKELFFQSDTPPPMQAVVVNSGLINTNIVGDVTTINNGLKLPPTYKIGSEITPILSSPTNHETIRSTDVLAEALKAREGRMTLKFAGFHQEGSPEVDKELPSFVELNQTKSIEFQTGGLVWNDTGALARIALVNQSGGPYIAEKIYLKLHRYAKCSLRDEYTTMRAPRIVPSYALHVSSDYNIYDLVPRASMGAHSIWSLKEGDADEFSLRLEYMPYILFVVSLIAEVKDQSNSESFRVSTDLLPLMRVTQGNTGGCLDLSEWYKPELLLKPAQARYSKQSSTTLGYQLLTLNAKSDRNFLLELVETQPLQILDALVKEVSIASDNSSENLVFRENLEWLDKLIKWKKSSVGDPP